MSMKTLERAILVGAQTVLKNPRLKMMDILEWSTGDIEKAEEDEVVVWLPDPGVRVCVKPEHDKRGKKS
jgi:hypothetical protein